MYVHTYLTGSDPKAIHVYIMQAQNNGLLQVNLWPISEQSPIW